MAEEEVVVESVKFGPKIWEWVKGTAKWVWNGRKVEQAATEAAEAAKAATEATSETTKAGAAAAKPPLTTGTKWRRAAVVVGGVGLAENIPGVATATATTLHVAKDVGIGTAEALGSGYGKVGAEYRKEDEAEAKAIKDKADAEEAAARKKRLDDGTPTFADRIKEAASQAASGSFFGPGTAIGALALGAVGLLAGSPLVAGILALVGAAGGQFVMDVIMPPNDKKPEDTSKAPAGGSTPAKTPTVAAAPEVKVPNVPDLNKTGHGK